MRLHSFYRTYYGTSIKLSFKSSIVHFTMFNFSELSSEVDSCVYSDYETDCLGNVWQLSLYPGGGNDF
jgi:hypothetical protein